MPEGNPFPDYSQMSSEMYRMWEKSMTSWWDQVLESPAFLSALGESVAQYSQARKSYEENVDRTMEQLHLPSRNDLVRLTRIATMLEDRLLSIEDRLLELDDRLSDLEKGTLRAQVDAAEALVLVRESLDTVRDQVQSLSSDADADAAE